MTLNNEDMQRDLSKPARITDNPLPFDLSVMLRFQNNFTKISYKEIMREAKALYGAHSSSATSK
jgi:hypothetical protein